MYIENRPDLIYAIGDVHGCYDLLLDLENLIINDADGVIGSKLIIMLGDYVDRGLRSREVIDHLIARPPSGFERICLAGNHEQMMSDFYNNPWGVWPWLEYGGDDTLASYGIFEIHNLKNRNLELALKSCIPEGHVEFIDRLPSLLATPDFVFVHAGLRPNIPLSQQNDADLLWIRGDFMNSESLKIASSKEFALEQNVRIVHGHIPNDEPVVSNTRICVDTGAYMSGELTALKIKSNGDISFLSSK
ncbi:MAG: serine/threonine protein phosphatase [Hyphomicrobiales bacterium]|nr:serine/threonine protein phosphatase [Hyphomicrobiales bacterium]